MLIFFLPNSAKALGLNVISPSESHVARYAAVWLVDVGDVPDEMHASITRKIPLMVMVPPMGRIREAKSSSLSGSDLLNERNVAWEGNIRGLQKDRVSDLWNQLDPKMAPGYPTTSSASVSHHIGNDNRVLLGIGDQRGGVPQNKPRPVSGFEFGLREIKAFLGQSSLLTAGHPKGERKNCYEDRGDGGESTVVLVDECALTSEQQPNLRRSRDGWIEAGLFGLAYLIAILGGALLIRE